MSDLLPCPFCANDLVFSDTYREYHHPVTKCILSGHKFKKGAIGQWNRRALPAVQPHVNKTQKSKHDAINLPVGMIMGFMNNPGPDWCLMDGRHLPAEQYPELAGVMTSWCRDGLIMLQDLSAYDVLPSRHYVKVRSWPEGLFHLTGDTLGLRCATAGCGQHVSTRYESDGIGSDYCEPCGRKKAQES